MPPASAAAPATLDITAAAPLADPTSRSAVGWSTRRAALVMHGAEPDDPRLAECDAALAYWRVRSVIDRERELLAPAHLPLLADLIYEPAPPPAPPVSRTRQPDARRRKQNGTARKVAR